MSVEKTLAGRLERLTKANDDAKEKLMVTSSQLKEAEEQRKEAEEQRKEAEEQRNEAEEQRKEAEEQLKRANEERMVSAKKLLQAGVSEDIVASTLNLSMGEMKKIVQDL